MMKFQLIVGFTLTAFLAAGAMVVKLQMQPVIERHTELYLPLKIKEWQGGELTLNEAAVQVIRPDSYLFRNYRKGGETVNMYVGYYGSLKKSDSAHIPSLCYPAQGWKIVENTEARAVINGRQIPFKRLNVQRGGDREIVYYGFKTPGIMTGSLLRLRTELARSLVMGKETENTLIRFSTPVTAAGAAVAETALQEFIGAAYPLLEGALGNGGGKHGKSTLL